MRLRLLHPVPTLFLFLFALGPLSAQEPAGGEPSPGEPWLYLGPRAGLTCAFTGIDRFDGLIQRFYPADHAYFPVYSQLGLGLAQHVRLQPGGMRLTFQEWVLVSGLDQNFALPALSLQVGLRGPRGLTLSLGPEITLYTEGGSVAADLALTYAAGWTFDFNGTIVPLLLVASPLPEDRVMRLSLLSGLDFGFRPKLLQSSRKQPPFNY